MAIDEAKIRQITETAHQTLGDRSNPELLKKIVRDVVRRLEEESGVETALDIPSTTKVAPGDVGRVIITVFGRNRPGVVSQVTDVLARHECDIVDITQKLLQDYFTMLMIVDTSRSDLRLEALKHELAEAGNRLGVRIIAQHEDVFKYMHRI